MGKPLSKVSSFAGADQWATEPQNGDVPFYVSPRKLLPLQYVCPMNNIDVLGIAFIAQMR